MATEQIEIKTIVAGTIERIIGYILGLLFIAFLITEAASCDRRTKAQEELYINAGYQYVTAGTWVKK